MTCILPWGFSFYGEVGSGGCGLFCLKTSHYSHLVRLSLVRQEFESEL